MSQHRQIHTIIDETRRSIIDAILALGCMKGDKQYHEFAKPVCTTLSLRYCFLTKLHTMTEGSLSNSVFKLFGLVKTGNCRRYCGIAKHKNPHSRSSGEERKDCGDFQCRIVK